MSFKASEAAAKPASRLSRALSEKAHCGGGVSVKSLPWDPHCGEEPPVLQLSRLGLRGVPRVTDEANGSGSPSPGSGFSGGGAGHRCPGPRAETRLPHVMLGAGCPEVAP
mmetsp:Transcript_102659/g.290662  ORF Transcript_102659/g.290662 Transcript_102659/m.290662 type:complete len:110 (+) Transcript_102659:230-559(+)